MSTPETTTQVRIETLSPNCTTCGDPERAPHGPAYNPPEMTPPPGQPGTRLRRLLFSLILLLLAVGVIEGVASAMYYGLVPADRRKTLEVALQLREGGSNSVLRYLPHPYTNYMGNPGYRNADGKTLHGENGWRPTTTSLRAKAPGALRLVALGGSTTYGMYFDQGTNVWPELVGMALRETLQREVEVINLGVPNYTTFEMLGLASMWIPELDADIALIHTGLNDAFSVGYSDEGGPDNREFRHAWSWRPMPAALQKAMRASRFLRMLGMQWVARGGYHIGDMSRAMQHRLPPEDEIRRNVEHADGRYFRRNVETLVVLCRRAGVEPVLIEMPLNPEFESGKGVYLDAVSRAVVRNNRILRQIAEEQDVAFVSLYDRMRDTTVYMDAAHVNVQGMMLKAQAVFEIVGARIAD